MKKRFLESQETAFIRDFLPSVPQAGLEPALALLQTGF